jgi:hypothetical protein
MVKAGDLVLANYYESRFLSQVEEVLGSPQSAQTINFFNIREYAIENGTQSLAIEGYKSIESDLTNRVSHQAQHGIMANIAANVPNAPIGSQMHKRFERDSERIKKKFVTLSKRSLNNEDPGINFT